MFIPVWLIILLVLLFVPMSEINALISILVSLVFIGTLVAVPLLGLIWLLN